MSYERKIIELRERFETTRDERIRKEAELESAVKEMTRSCDISTVEEAAKKLPIIVREKKVLEKELEELIQKANEKIS